EETLAASPAAPPCWNSCASPSREQHGRQLPARSDRPWIGWSHCLKKRDQMLACRLVVPFAVAPHDFEQFLNGAFAIAFGVTRQCEVEARLVIVWILLQPAVQFSAVAGASRLFAQLEFR